MNIIFDFFCDVLIIGSGVVGFFFVLCLVEYSLVIVLSKGLISEGLMFYVQGGIVVVFDEMDSIEFYVEDILIVGVGLCDCYVVIFVVSNVRLCVQWFIDQGVLFDIQVQVNGEESYYFMCEGGYSYWCIFYVVDVIGKVVEMMLVDKVFVYFNICIFECSNVVDLIVLDKIGLSGMCWVVGVWIWNCNKEWVEICSVKVVVFVIGGVVKVY